MVSQFEMIRMPLPSTPNSITKTLQRTSMAETDGDSRGKSLLRLEMHFLGNIADLWRGGWLRSVLFGRRVHEKP